MLKRSGKVQFLFWLAFFAILFALWISAILLIGFAWHTTFSEPTIKLLFVLYFITGIASLIGLLLSILINNRHYQKIFSIIIFILFVSLLAIRSVTD